MRPPSSSRVWTISLLLIISSSIAGIEGELPFIAHPPDGYSFLFSAYADAFRLFFRFFHSHCSLLCRPSTIRRIHAVHCGPQDGSGRKLWMITEICINKKTHDSGQETTSDSGTGPGARQGNTAPRRQSLSGGRSQPSEGMIADVSLYPPHTCSRSRGHTSCR